MTLDFNDAPEQREFLGPIPEGSMVKVRLTLRVPRQGKAMAEDPNIFQAETGLLGLDCEYEVVSGRFTGRKLWEYLWLPPKMQRISLSDKQKGSCDGAMAKMRAILEATRNIDPKDLSPQAQAARKMNAWFDLNGLEFGVLVGIEKPKAGDRYINNSVRKILTPKYEEYRNIMAGGEIITDEPVPEIPEGNADASPKPAWGQTAKATPPPPATEQKPGWGAAPSTSKTAPPPPAANSARPSWGQPGRQSSAPPPGHPANATMDEVPWT